MYQASKESSNETFVAPGIDDQTSEVATGRDRISFVEKENIGSQSERSDKVRDVPKSNNMFMFSVSFFGLFVIIYFLAYLFK